MSAWALANRLGNIEKKSSKNHKTFIASHFIFVNLICSSFRQTRAANGWVSCANATSESARLVGSAWRGIPPGSVRNFLEMRVSKERFDEVLRIGDHGRHRQPGVFAIGVCKRIVEFFQLRVGAVRNSVLLQIARDAYLLVTTLR